VSPRPALDIALGLLLGLIAGMATALARHTLDRTVKTPDALGDLLQVPVLGATQYDQGVRTQPLIVHDNPRAPLAEAFRQLRTNLDYVDLDKSNKLIVITSALPHEGKTVVACNLAIAMAQSGNKVVVVEADLRRPRAAEYLGMENAVGLTSVLTGQVPLSVALQPWRGGLLDFLGAGPLPPNPSELLASSQMVAVLADLRSRYNTVIFDAAPTLPVADAAVLAAQCDGVLFVARYGWARTDQIRAAAETIRRVAAPIFGVVLSMGRAKQGGGYAYQYGYTYKADRSGRRPEARLRLTPPPPVTVPTVAVAQPTTQPWATVPAPRATPRSTDRWPVEPQSLDDLGWRKATDR
jgi:capsular exopolysaccharide synthesis family protein